jgi:hypothetical protein
VGVLRCLEVYGRTSYHPRNKTPPRFSLVMTRNDNRLQDAVPTQKLEWVTPKISLMEVGDTSGKVIAKAEGTSTVSYVMSGPS